MNELALFAGAGGGILGGHLLGWRTICAVEVDTYAASVLIARQNDGHLPAFPIWDDVCTFDGRLWRGRVDVISGGFPCTDISAAGKGAGIEGKESGLWREMARIIREVRPRFVFVENSPMLTCRGLGRVLGDLAAMGFDAEWGVVSAQDAIWLAGDPCLYHERERIWIVACSDSNSSRQVPGLSQSTRRKQTGEPVRFCASSSNSNGDGWPQVERKNSRAAQEAGIKHSALQSRPRKRTADWWRSESHLVRVANGVAAELD